MYPICRMPYACVRHKRRTSIHWLLCIDLVELCGALRGGGLNTALQGGGPRPADTRPSLKGPGQCNHRHRRLCICQCRAFRWCGKRVAPSTDGRELCELVGHVIGDRGHGQIKAISSRVERRARTSAPRIHGEIEVDGRPDVHPVAHGADRGAAILRGHRACQGGKGTVRVFAPHQGFRAALADCSDTIEQDKEREDRPRASKLKQWTGRWSIELQYCTINT